MFIFSLSYSKDYSTLACGVTLSLTTTGTGIQGTAEDSTGVSEKLAAPAQPGTSQACSVLLDQELVALPAECA